MSFTEILNPELIKAASTDWLAILALMILICCVLILVLFARKSAPVWARFSLVFLFIAGTVLLGLSLLSTSIQQTADSPSQVVRLNVHFRPQTDPNNEGFAVEAFSRQGVKEEPLEIAMWRVMPGGISVWFEVPDVNTPFFAVFRSADGVWRTPEYSIMEPTTLAEKVDLN